MDNSTLRFLRSSVFWTWCIVTLALVGALFLWEMMLPRPPPTSLELGYIALLAFLLSLAAGLFGWQRRNGSCPVGVKRAVGVAGTLGGLALLCPVCLALPATFLGVGTLIAIVGQFLPLVRLVALIFAITAVWLLWPRSTAPKNGHA